MKQLSEILSNISHTASKMESAHAVQKYTLTKDDSKMITQVSNALIVKNDITKESLSASLKLLLNLPENPKLTTQIVYRSDGYGADFIPDRVEYGQLTDEQKQKGLEFISMMKRPMSVDAINKLYTKLRLSTKHTRDESKIDEKLRIAVYVDELRKHPANVVREVMSIPYEFFPTLNEIICDCEREERMLNCFEKGLK